MVKTGPVGGNTSLCSPITEAFSSSDIVVRVLHALIDVDSLPYLLSLALVSKNFAHALQSDIVWREICYKRWKSKWGFHSRWKNAQNDFSSWQKEHQGHIKWHSDFDDFQFNRLASRDQQFWRARYFLEEQDAKRNIILADELEQLVFDMRFWIGQPEVGETIIVRSGLFRSASTQVRFRFTCRNSSRDSSSSSTWWSARGIVSGHPCNEPGIEWFLNESCGTIQWGFVPNLWPQGMVKRLATWGWEIHNPNVIMRSIDPLPLSLGKRSVTSLESEGIDEDDNHNGKMWNDVLNDLRRVPLSNAPIVNGYPVTAEIPRAFLDTVGMTT